MPRLATIREVNPLRRRILLVEDHEPTRKTLALLLRRRNYSVVMRGLVREAREHAAAGRSILLCRISVCPMAMERS